jgi:hypothetical protein
MGFARALRFPGLSVEGVVSGINQEPGLFGSARGKFLISQKQQEVGVALRMSDDFRRMMTQVCKSGPLRDKG